MVTSPRTSRKRPSRAKPVDESRRRKRCMNCNGLMKPGKITKKFCGPEDPGKGECKNEYHRHGSAFGPLKTRLETLVKKLTRETFKTLEEQIDALEKRVKSLECPDDPLS